MDNRSEGTVPVALILLLFTSVFGSLLSTNFLKPKNPGCGKRELQKNGNITYFYSRLWEDPFTCKASILNTTTNTIAGEHTEKKEKSSHSTPIAANSNVFKGVSRFIAVMMPVADFPINKERRIRTRFAAIHGLLMAGYHPVHSDRIYFAKVARKNIPFEFFIKENESETTKVCIFYIKDEWICKTPNKKICHLFKQITDIANKHHGKLDVIGPTSSGMVKELYNEQMEPVERLVVKFNRNYKNYLVFKEYLFRNNKKLLQEKKSYIALYKKNNSSNNKTAIQVNYYSPWATADPNLLLGNVGMPDSTAPYKDIESFFVFPHVSFKSFVRSDAKLSWLLMKELQMRYFQFENCNNFLDRDCIAIIGEWDNTYSTNLATTLKASFVTMKSLIKASMNKGKADTKQPRESSKRRYGFIDFARTIAFNYQRHVSENANIKNINWQNFRNALCSNYQVVLGRDSKDEVNGKKQSKSNNWFKQVKYYTYLAGVDGVHDKKSNKEEKGEKRSTSTFAIGESQLDYIARLATRIREGFPDSGTSRLRAVILVGSNIYDKLQLLQALRHRFPNTLFMTTDLDARYLDRNENMWTRNLIVASSYGLDIEADWQNSIFAVHGNIQIPPFRDSYQVATALATYNAAAESNSELACDDKMLLNFNNVYEIGRTKCFRLPLSQHSDRMSIHKSTASTNKMKSYFYTYIILSLVFCGFIAILCHCIYNQFDSIKKIVLCSQYSAICLAIGYLAVFAYCIQNHIESDKNLFIWQNKLLFASIAGFVFCNIIFSVAGNSNKEITSLKSAFPTFLSIKSVIAVVLACIYFSIYDKFAFYQQSLKENAIRYALVFLANLIFTCFVFNVFALYKAKLKPQPGVGRSVNSNTWDIIIVKLLAGISIVLIIFFIAYRLYYVVGNTMNIAMEWKLFIISVFVIMVPLLIFWGIEYKGEKILVLKCLLIPLPVIVLAGLILDISVVNGYLLSSLLPVQKYYLLIAPGKTILICAFLLGSAYLYSARRKEICDKRNKLTTTIFSIAFTNFLLLLLLPLLVLFLVTVVLFHCLHSITFVNNNSFQLFDFFRNEPFAWLEGVSVVPASLAQIVILIGGFIVIIILAHKARKVKSIDSAIIKLLKKFNVKRFQDISGFLERQTTLSASFRKLGWTLGFSTIYVIVCFCVYSILFPEPILPARGQLTLFEWLLVMRVPSLIATIILFYVFIKIYYMSTLLMKINIQLDKGLTEQELLELPKLYNSVSERSQIVGEMVGWPFLLLILSLLTYNHYFDRYPWTISLTISVLIYLAFSLFNLLLLKYYASAFKNACFSIINDSVINLRLECCTGGSKHNEIFENYQFAADLIQNKSYGIYAPFYKNPYFSAIIIPLVGSGTVFLIDYLK